MASIKYGFGVSDIRGSIQGTTFSHGSSGNVIYRKPHIVNKNTNLQNTQRQRFYYFANYWKLTLTTAQRTYFESLAQNLLFTNRLGDSFHISGFNLFMKINMFNFLCGNLVTQTTSTMYSFASVLIPQTSMISLTASNNRITFSASAFIGFSETTTTDFLLVYAAPATYEKTKLNDKYFRFVGYTHGAGGGGGFSPAYLTIPWFMANGLYMRIKVKHIVYQNRFWEEAIFQKIISA